MLKKSESMEYSLASPSFPLTHELNPHFDEIRRYRKRRDFDKSEIAARLKPEIDRVTQGVEWSNRLAPAFTAKKLRVVHWNVERGKRLDGLIHTLKNNPILKEADALLLSETDVGMGRSGNRNVPREIADALGMNYFFSNSFLSFGKGDESEQSHTLENSLSLHGLSALSKYKFESARTLDLPRVKEVFHSTEKRLGRRRALVVSLGLDAKRCDLAVTHLDVHSSPAQRADQLATVLDDLRESPADIKIVGGDFNCSTYDLKSKGRLFKNLWYKMRHLTFRQVIEHYMTPEALFEKPLFEAIEARGFDYKSVNDLKRGTFYYDIHDPYVRDKTLRFIPNWALKWLERKLEPWKGCVPLRLDWFAGWGTEVLGVHIVERPRWNGRLVSDHNPIVVDLRI